MENKENIKISCGHDTTDLSHNFGNGLFGEPKRVVHKMCLKCNIHVYDGKHYTSKEWDEYIENAEILKK